MNIKHFINKQRITNCLLFALIFINIGPYLLNLGSLWHGDWISQYYPWLYEFKKSLSLNTLPFWSPNLGGGFPLLAEGQLGCFYPFNILLLKFLNVPLFVNLSIWVHLLITSFFFIKWLGLKEEINLQLKLTGVAVICFGSFAGGISLGGLAPMRAFSMFMIQLFLLEKFFVKNKNKYLFLNGIIAGLNLLSGYVQLSIISNFFLYFYFIIKRKKIDDILKYSFFLIPTALIFLPQFLETIALINMSSRNISSLQIMMQNSLNPFSFITFILPHLSGIFNITLYMTIPVFISSIFFFLTSKKYTELKILAFIFFLLSLGKWNPLNYLFYYLPLFNKIRGQNKWILITYIILIFFGIVGINHLYKNKDKFLKFTLWISLISYFFISAVHYFFLFFKEFIINIANLFVTNFIFNAPGHIQNIEYYLEKTNNFYEKIIYLTNPFLPKTILSFCILIIFCLITLKAKSFNKYLQLTTILILIDLSVFNYSQGLNSGLTFKKTYNEPSFYEKLNPTETRAVTLLPEPIIQGKISYYIPNINLVYNIDSLGIYTPLSIQSLKNYFIDIQLVNDAFGRKPVMLKTFEENIPKLQKASVTHIISEKPLTHKDLTLVGSLDKILLYKINNSNPLLFTNEKDILRLNQIKTINNGIYFTYYARDNTEATLNYTYHPNLSALLNNTTYLEIKQDEFSPFIKISLPKGENSIKIKYNFLKRHEKKIQN